LHNLCRGRGSNL